MVVRFPDGRATAIDFREKAPLAAHPEMFLDESGEYSFERHHNSHIAVGVPGTVAGFWMAHGKYGTGAWSDLVDPAVDLAADGFEVSERLSRGLEYLMGRADRMGYQGTIDAYSRSGQPYAEGETLRLPDLAGSLERIRDQGRNEADHHSHGRACD